MWVQVPPSALELIDGPLFVRACLQWYASAFGRQREPPTSTSELLQAGSQPRVRKARLGQGSTGPTTCGRWSVRPFPQLRVACGPECLDTAPSYDRKELHRVPFEADCAGRRPHRPRFPRAAGCGGSSKKAATTTGTSASITAPASIASSGTLAFCSDITYPPEESYKQGTTTPQGSDIDIGSYIAGKMGVKARFDNTGFDGIIAALLAKKCDAVISGMNDTPERRKQVAFVDYLKVGQSFMVKSGTRRTSRASRALRGRQPRSRRARRTRIIWTPRASFCRHTERRQSRS